MIELLRRAARDAPEHPALVTAEGEVTFGQLCERAETVAGALRERGIERLAVLVDDPLVTWVLLAGASLAGAEACLYPVAATDETVQGLRGQLRHDRIVTSRPLDTAGVVPPDELVGGPRLVDEPPASRRLLVLTSGTTTGTPQAAQHEWSRLLRVAERIDPAPDQRWLLAYGLNQFAGLQMLIHVAAAQATLVVGRSFQPRDGLDAMRRAQVTHASGTPTFWRFLLAELRADGGNAPSLAQITLGGEAVPAALIDQLRSTFPAARISQLYAATEMGLSVSVRDGEAGLPLSVLDGARDVEFKIVDGELWVRSASSMLGYFDQEPLAGSGWRASGDLVEVIGDRIHFQGRKSEVINVGGVKVHPLPIEDRVSAVPGVAVVRAFGRANAMVGQIVAIEVVPVEGADEDALRDAIAAAVGDLPPAARPRSIRFVATIDVSGNKLTRGSRS
ncbi:MAG TPA: class I adenylate-forming enzyme family protein [Jatrophihabitans sp.]|jgi:acyl-CoA synthetase (AMP-forming)/AMP-acid ligase II|uniref:class I adenylate-forming enzyme family protein n=1 Tax=Jatrophihabitans sp. TaxID=1932789 RepID=UPI002E07C8FE|nr:class I adenylate-forming enzyme family protein [Jatrophihabitans sp.]